MDEDLTCILFKANSCFLRFIEVAPLWANRSGSDIINTKTVQKQQKTNSFLLQFQVHSLRVPSDVAISLI